MQIRITCANGHALIARPSLRGRSVACPRCGSPAHVPAATQTSSSPREAPAKMGAHGIDLSRYAPPAVVGTGLGSSKEPTPTWYVAVESGEQFGPIETETIHAWVRERRVTASALIWRTGWAAWRTASTVLPFSTASSPALDEPLAAPAIVEQLLEKRPPSRYQLRKRRRERALWASGVLLIIAVGLVGILVAVVRRQQSDEAFRQHAGSRMIQQVVDRT